jgi:hypothetical protein
MRNYEVSRKMSLSSRIPVTFSFSDMLSTNHPVNPVYPVLVFWCLGALVVQIVCGAFIHGYSRKP